jgi:cytoskeletal protein CcmA (bactofilin family)
MSLLVNISATGNVGIDGEIHAANGTITNNLSVAGNIDGSILNLSGNFVSQGNLSLVGTATIDGNVSANNISGLGDISTTGNLLGNNLTGTGNLSVTGNITGNNLSIDNLATLSNVALSGTIDGNLIPSANNTKSIGTSSNVWSNIHLGDQGVLIGNTSITNVNGAITTPTANITGNLNTSNLDISHSTTAHGDVTILGNLTVSGTTEYINVTELSVMDPVISLGGEADGQDSAGYDGKDRGMLLRNYLEDGSNPENHFLGWKSSDREFVAIATVADSTGDVITVGEFGNVRANTFKGNVEGRVLTAAQPNITSVGTLASLSLSGAITTPGAANVGSLKASGITYPTADGDSGQVLTTNGAGDLFFGSPVSNQLVNGNSNVVVNANSNVTISVAGVANVVNVTNTAATVKGNVAS